MQVFTPSSRLAARQFLLVAVSALLILLSSGLKAQESDVKNNSVLLEKEAANDSVEVSDDPDNPLTTPGETLTRLVLNTGSHLLMTGIVFPTVHQLPSTMPGFCGDNFLLECDWGQRISFEKRGSADSMVRGFGFTRYTLDGTDNMTTALYSKGWGVGLDVKQIVGAGAEVSFGLGVTHLRVNNDKAFSPTADVDVSVLFNISRLVYRLGGYYRDMMDVSVDGIDYGTSVKGLYLSVGFSL